MKEQLMEFTTAYSTHRKSITGNHLLKIYLVLFSIAWVLTFIYTTDRTNWFTENTLTFLLLAGLISTYRIFKFSDLSYTLILVFTLLHVYGAQYTYAENPLGYWLKEVFHMQRNQYDRIVHFSFGLMLTYPMHDYFKNWFQWPAWVCFVLPVEITMSFSAAYELLEWLVAEVFFPHEGPAYLGTQGDVWDAQKDMGIAFLGAVISTLVNFSITKLLAKKKS